MSLNVFINYFQEENRKDAITHQYRQKHKFAVFENGRKWTKEDRKRLVPLARAMYFFRLLSAAMSTFKFRFWQV